jgi:hypothetical protein
LFIAGIPYQNKRFLILTLPLIVILFFPLAIKSINIIRSSFQPFIVLLLLIFNIFVSIYTTKTIVDISNVEMTIIQLIKPIENEKIYTFEMDIPLAGRKINNTYFNLLSNKITQTDPGDYFLINPEKWENQWENTNVMINCQLILNDTLIVKIKELPYGWELYKKL